MDRLNSNNSNDQSIHNVDVNHLDNNNSFQDYLQSSAHNLSFTKCNQGNFDIEDNYFQLPNQTLSPVHRSSNYIPQSFLSKPFEDHHYDTVEQKWKLDWTNQHNSSLQCGFGNNANTPLDGRVYFQNVQDQTQQKGDSIWDSKFQNEDNKVMGMFIENTILNDTKDTQININKNSFNSHLRQNSLQEKNFLIDMDMEEEFPNPVLFKKMKQDSYDQMDIEGRSHLDYNGQNEIPTYKNNEHNIIMNYDNYKQTLQSDERTLSHLKGDNISTISHGQPLNYLFANLNDNLINDTKFSPIKPAQNIPFISPTYFPDKTLPQSQFDKYPSPSNQFSKEISSSNSLAVATVSQFNISSLNNNDNKFSNNIDYNNNDQNNNNNNNNNNQMESISNNYQLNSRELNQRCVCNCKKTKCLKLYCECFAKLGYCGAGCHCHECKNRPENEVERQNAIQEAKLRKQDAFLPKVVNEQEQLENKRKALNEQIKGCNCRKTSCLKKYCECFNAGAYCNNNCKCHTCQNHPSNAALILLIKNNQFSHQIPSQIRTIENCPTSLIVSNQNQGGYNYQNYQNAFGYPSISSLQLENQTSRYISSNQLSYPNSLNPHSQVVKNALSTSNHFDSLLVEPQSLYKQNDYQARLLFNDNNEDSDPANSSSKSKQDKNYIINKLRKQKKKPIIKSRREALENSDEEIEKISQESYLQQPQLVKLLRTKKVGGDASESHNLKNNISISDEEAEQQQRIIEMEKKLKQIQQVQSLLQQQQMLKQQQHLLLNENHHNSISQHVFQQNPIKKQQQKQKKYQE